MSIIPQARFQEFLQDIEPSPTTKANASTAHTDLRNFLSNDEEFRKYHVSDFLSGSYKRDTAIRPQKKGDQIDKPDIDIIVVTNFTISDDPNEAVDLLFKTLKRKYPDIRRQNRSVGVNYYKADMDIVPAIASGDRYLIPDRKAGQWILTDPSKHTSWTTETNDSAGGRFKPLVKLLKWYRREHPTISKKPKGLTLECMVSQCMDYQETDFGELFVKTLEEMVFRYGPSVEAGIVPSISDPAISGNSVTNDIDYKAFFQFYDKVKADALKARKILSGSDLDEATDVFREIFGDRFPKGPTANSTSTLLQAPVAGATTFPKKPIRPNKPAGFAYVVFRRP